MLACTPVVIAGWVLGRVADMEPVRWGVLSTSSFAERVFLPGLRKCRLVRVTAVASRDRAKAERYAARNKIPAAYGTYEELLADPSIEVIYNPLPNDMHVEWTRRAAEAGKHVLCEKPMGLDAASLEQLLPVASQVHIAEGFMVRHHPQWTETRERIRSGELGRITHLHVEFAFTNTDAANIRNIASSGGGAMYDIGCYAVVAARWFLEAEPLRIAAVADRDPQFGVDRLTSALMEFSEGRTCTFTVSTQSVPHQRVHVFGTAGRMELTIPFNQPQDGPVVYLTHQGRSADGLDARQHKVKAADQYTLQGDAFSLRVRTEAPTDAPLRDAMANMRAIDAVFRSAASGRFEAV
jgi:predicted dehydrogenase